MENQSATPENFKRTLITATAGAGNRGSLEDSVKCGSFVIHLDDLHWEPGHYGVARNRTQRDEDVKAAAQADAWIMEGVYGQLVNIALKRVTEGTAIYTQMLLAREGLKYPGDYDFALAGIHTKRWEALQAGEIDCAPQPAPWNFVAEQAGYNLIGEVNDVIPEILFAALIANRSWLDANSETVGKLLAALADAYVITNDPSMEEITLPIFQRITVPDNADLARRGLRYMRDMGMWPQDLAIPDKALETTIDLMIRAGLLEEGNRASATRVFDCSYLQKVLG